MSGAERDLMLEAEVRDLIYLEADILDRQRWKEWTDLYTEDCIFWVPSWADEENMIDDPETEINTIYLKGKAGLEARLFRITSRDSYASLPLARTSHVIGSVRITGQDASSVQASAKWTVLSMDARRGKMVRGGWYDFDFARTEDGLKIRQKKIALLESMIDGTIDIYQI
ncbi:hypothetical protein E0K89_000415 [Aquicoccus sp. SCR17]|nr:hypothetical protein [Carideicomes alvinocaridis]